MDNKPKRKKKKSKLLMVLLLILAALFLAVAGVLIYGYSRLNRTRRNAVPTVPMPENLPTETVAPDDLVPVEDPSQLDLTEDYDPEIDPSEISFDDIFQRDAIDKDTINILYIVRDADGRPIDFGSESKSWNNIWIGNLYVSDTKKPLENEGSCTLEIYFDRQLLASQTFTVV